MSCGTGFSCGVHRFDKYKFPQHDKPANKVLHHENEKRLKDLLQLREQQDQGLFQPITMQPITMQPIALQPIMNEKQDITLLHQDHGSVLYYSVSDAKIKKD
jgi:hypothetical protein